MDFTLQVYKGLIESLQKQGFSFQTYYQFLQKPENRSIILRHDVDKLPGNSLEFGNILNEFGIRGSFFFRIIPESYDEDIIKKIAALGHEVGYHYEDIDLTSKMLRRRNKKDRLLIEDIIDLAIKNFEKNLEKIRKVAQVNTICMHGSPLSKYDNRLLWEKYTYKDFGIIGEPYFDIDFSQVLYLTDTGRRWDGNKVSIRDKTDIKTKYSFHSTKDIIKAAEAGKLPQQVMMNFHPQRWVAEPLPWIKELILQNAKNVVKRILVRFNRL